MEKNSIVNWVLKRTAIFSLEMYKLLWPKNISYEFNEKNKSIKVNQGKLFYILYIVWVKEKVARKLNGSSKKYCYLVPFSNQYFLFRIWAELLYQSIDHTTT